MIATKETTVGGTTAPRTATRDTRVAVVGAGPYGLSIGAHLRALGVDVRVFGTPMETWMQRMPKGMFLKSEGFASSLYDFDGAFTLADYCRDHDIPYADVGLPVALETFTNYGLAFQQRFVPDLDRRSVANVERTGAGFTLTLDDGSQVRAASVVIAAGISVYDALPPMLANAPAEFVTHAAAHHTLDRFRGRHVTVIGSGASALDLAGLLHEAGADTHLVARTKHLAFQDPPAAEPRPLIRRMRYPRSGLGQGLKSLFYSHLPDVFFNLPLAWRIHIVRTALGPAPCWFTRAQVEEKVATHLGLTLDGVEIAGSKARLHTRDESGTAHTFETDHIIAGTGYKVDLARLEFLSGDLRSTIRKVNSAPVLSRTFESSVPDLYFVGVSAAQTFGPLLRFAFGARFAARRITSRFVGEGAATRGSINAG